MLFFRYSPGIKCLWDKTNEEDRRSPAVVVLRFAGSRKIGKRVWHAPSSVQLGARILSDTSSESGDALMMGCKHAIAWSRVSSQLHSVVE